MLTELGYKPLDATSIPLSSSADNQAQSDPEGVGLSREELVFGNALLSTQKLQQVEDIRAIFQILGIGS